MMWPPQFKQENACPSFPFPWKQVTRITPRWSWLTLTRMETSISLWASPRQRPYHSHNGAEKRGKGVGSRVAADKATILRAKVPSYQFVRFGCVAMSRFMLGNRMFIA